MAGYCTPDQIAALLSFDLNTDGTAPEASSAGLQKRIDYWSKKARSIWRDRFAAIVADPTPPITAQQSVLELFVLLKCSAEYARVKAGDINAALDLQATTLERFADRIETDLREGALDQLVLAAPLSLTTFCEVGDCEIDAAGFSASADDDNGPVEAAIEDLIQSYSILTRCAALDRSSTAFDNALTDDEAELYRTLTAKPIRALIALLKRSNADFSGSKNSIVNQYIDQAFGEFDALRSGTEDLTFA